MAENGRWWKTPSFSVEDLIKWLFLIGPLTIFWLTIWLDIRDLKTAFSEGVHDANEIHATLSSRIDVLEHKHNHTQVQQLKKVPQWNEKN